MKHIHPKYGPFPRICIWRSVMSLVKVWFNTAIKISLSPPWSGELLLLFKLFTGALEWYRFSQQTLKNSSYAVIWCLSCTQNGVYANWVWKNYTTFPGLSGHWSLICLWLCVYLSFVNAHGIILFMSSAYSSWKLPFIFLLREISLGNIRKLESLPFLNITLCQHFPSLCQIFDTAFLRY